MSLSLAGYTCSLIFKDARKVKMLQKYFNPDIETSKGSFFNKYS